MSTTLERRTGNFDPEIARILDDLANKRHTSVSNVLNNLVMFALTVLEDMHLSKVGLERYESFKEEKSLTSEELLAWNETRKT